jgi:hypothetical protein
MPRNWQHMQLHPMLQEQPLEPSLLLLTGVLLLLQAPPLCSLPAAHLR